MLSSCEISLGTSCCTVSQTRSRLISKYSWTRRFRMLMILGHGISRYVSLHTVLMRSLSNDLDRLQKFDQWFINEAKLTWDLAFRWWRKLPFSLPISLCLFAVGIASQLSYFLVTSINEIYPYDHHYVKINLHFCFTRGVICYLSNGWRCRFAWWFEQWKWSVLGKRMPTASSAVA